MAQGKVYELLRTVAAKRQEAESNFIAPRKDGVAAELWDEIGLWCVIRNEVAHRGSWRLPDGATPTAERLAVEQAFASRGFGGQAGYGAQAVLDAIGHAVESTFRAALFQAL